VNHLRLAAFPGGPFVLLLVDLAAPPGGFAPLLVVFAALVAFAPTDGFWGTGGAPAPPLFGDSVTGFVPVPLRPAAWVGFEVAVGDAGVPCDFFGGILLWIMLVDAWN